MSLAPKFLLGLTGGIGSGKTSIANIFEELGATLVDTDLIAHALTAPNGKAIPEILSHFGKEFLTHDGAMDRAKMRARVFADTQAKHQLESILHPLIREETERAIQQSKGCYTILIVPLLIETGNWRDKLDRLLVVDCSESTQVSRVMSRNGFSEAQVHAIMRNQANRQERLDAADDVIFNELSFVEIRAQVLRLHANYLQLSQMRTKKRDIYHTMFVFFPA